MSSAERRALLLLLTLALVGQGVRWLMGRPGEAPGEVQLLSVLPARSPGAHRDSIIALSRPLGPDERIDADRATAEELARLPRVGVALAKAIVADREARRARPAAGPGEGAVILTLSAPSLASGLSPVLTINPSRVHRTMATAAAGGGDRLGEVLLREGLLSREQLAQALGEQKASKHRL